MILFKPFKYIDNFNTMIKCSDGKEVSSGATIVFTYDGQLDNFNQTKALKVCAYDIVFDYGNQFPYPQNVKFEYLIKTDRYSSWFQAGFVVMLFLILILMILKLSNIHLVKDLYLFYSQNKLVSLCTIVLYMVISLLFFQVFFKSDLQNIYCKNVLQIQQKDFKLSVNLSGKEYPYIEYDWAKAQEKKFLNKCLQQGYVYKE